jgi:hypothetical protein
MNSTLPARTTPVAVPSLPLDAPPSDVTARFAEWRAAVIDAVGSGAGDITDAQHERMIKSIRRIAKTRSTGVADVLAKMLVVSYESRAQGDDDAAATVFDSALADLGRLASVALTATDKPGRRMTPRATMESQTRQACLMLGMVWLRENGSQKFGKQKVSDLSDAELLTTHTAASAAVSALWVESRPLPPRGGFLTAASGTSDGPENMSG